MRSFDSNMRFAIFHISQLSQIAAWKPLRDVPCLQVAVLAMDQNQELDLYSILSFWI